MGKTILLADDSSTIRRIVELTFSDTEYRVETADSGAAAMEKLKALRPDLVLADVVMPGPTGYEICRSIKQSDRPVPVVLLAGTFEPFDESRAVDCGADDHLVKPFESDLLREKVARLIAEAEAAAIAAAQPEPEPLPEEPPVSETIEVEIDAAVEEEVAGEEPAVGDPEVSPELVDAVARAVVKKLSAEVLREIAWDVVPDLARTIIRERIRELEQEDS